MVLLYLWDGLLAILFSLYCSPSRFVYFSLGVIPENLPKHRRLDCIDLDTMLWESDKALEDWSAVMSFYQDLFSNVRSDSTMLKELFYSEKTEMKVQLFLATFLTKC